MNIEEYYKQTANASLNASLVAFFPPFLFIIFSIIAIPYIKFVIFTMPFILYSFICFQNYLVNINRSRNVKSISKMKNKKSSNIFKSKNLLFTLMPAPSLRMLLFEPNGNVVGEIRDLKFSEIRWYLPSILDKFFSKSYGLYNDKNELIVQYRILKNGVEILDLNKKNYFIEEMRTDKKLYVKYRSNKTIIMRKELLFTNYRFFNEDEIEIAQLKKGWMPIEWGNRFLDPNTPIIYFNDTLEDKDKILLFGIFVKLYAYKDH